MGRFFDAFRSRRVWLLIGLGFASGLPLLLSGQTLGAWMTKQGVSLKTIGLFSLVSLPYNFKFLWAPFLDRFSVPLLGRRRGWLALFQLAIVAVVFAMSGIDPRAAPKYMALFAILLAVFSASQDIVSDAYRADILPSDERASGTATFLTGYRAAVLVAGSVSLILSDYVPWPRIYQLMGALMATGVIVTLVAPEPTGIRPPRTIKAAVVEPFRNFFIRRGALIALAFMLLYKFGEYVSDAMSVPFLIKTGFSGTEIGALRKFIGALGMVGGVMLGGGMTPKIGMRRALLIFGILEGLTNGGYVALALVGKNHALLVAVVAIDTFCRGLAATTFSAYMLALCDKSFSATQFALFSSASSVAGRLFSASAGYLVSAIGWAGFFSVTIFMAIPGLLLIPYLPMEAPGPDESGGLPATPELKTPDPPAQAK
jgi:PAT family beta-lactamase induction signal transducer AmpG